MSEQVQSPGWQNPPQSPSSWMGNQAGGYGSMGNVPVYTGGAPQGQAVKPSAQWPLSIVSLIFSFLLGAVAIYFSCQVGARWNRGDVVGAAKASKMAMIWSVIAIVVGGFLTIAMLASG